MKKKIISILTVFALVLSSFSVCAGAVTGYNEWEKGWDEIRNTKSYIMLTPGEDETRMNFSYQTGFSSAKGSFVIGEKPDLSDGKALETSRSLCIFGFEWSNTATAENLKENTKYYYCYRQSGESSNIYSFTTYTSGSTKIAFFTDSQIGRYRGSDDQEEIYLHDTYGWNKTVETVLENNSGVNFFLSSGDQVEDSYSEEQYSLFESVPALRSYPVAASVGNHDFYTTNFSHHFNCPNADTPIALRWPGSNDYYFCYNGILFIVLDSNNVSTLSHDRVLSEAVKAYPDARWRIAVMHHSPYDANSHKYFLSKMTRYTIAPVFDKYDVDVVLSGHDHYYSRSYMISGNRVTDDVALNNVYSNPRGTLYVSGNSASGSNFSSIDTTNVNEFCDVYYQEDIPCYSLLTFSGGRLGIETFEVEGNKLIDSVGIIK